MTSPALSRRPGRLNRRRAGVAVLYALLLAVVGAAILGIVVLA